MFFPVIPNPGPRVPRRSNVITRWLARTFLAILGWRVSGNLPDLEKFEVVWAPHTSYWDFFICMGVMFSMDLEATWLMTERFFPWPFRRLLLWMGGYPVPEKRHCGTVAKLVKRFREDSQFVMSISPEGMRSKPPRWRTGFYYIAHGADVPMVIMSLDYGTKTVHLGPVLRIESDVESEIARLRHQFDGVAAKHPEQF